MRIAFVGTGGIARAHLNALLQLKDAKIVSMIDLHREKAREAAARCGAEAYGALEDCLDDVDAVYILTHRPLTGSWR